MAQSVWKFVIKIWSKNDEFVTEGEQSFFMEQSPT